MNNKCYVVMAHEEYEGSEPIKAFLNKDAANEFCDECNDYHSTRPEDFEGDPFNENEIYVNDDGEMESVYSHEFDQWISIFYEWSKKHPAGVKANAAHSFRVIELPFDDD
jgi:hypothetical protein